MYKQQRYRGDLIVISIGVVLILSLYYLHTYVQANPNTYLPPNIENFLLILGPFFDGLQRLL